METKFNFKSQPCTSREQSEHLLALGLKKETADMCLQSTLNDVWSPYIPIAMPYSKVEAFDLSTDVFRVIPAWSLHRLLMMLDSDVQTDGRYVSLPNYGFVKNDNIYDNLCDCIEWLIKEGYFKKDYLEE